MTERLFVYGTLRPGHPNEHILEAVGGRFEPAVVRGTLHQAGWGATMGYPAIVPDDDGGEVEGFVFTSENLAGHWQALDEFEGDAYRRILTKAKLKDGTTVDAYVYTMNSR
jgi:gamma-glutamylcyclotransferase (GGCT)/AIG2-like uncharacterized protein YtfP